MSYIIANITICYKMLNYNINTKNNFKFNLIFKHKILSDK